MQPNPVKNSNPHSWDLVVEEVKHKRKMLKKLLKDMKKRDMMGFEKYKTHLQPGNGRDTLLDLHEELLDALVYSRTLMYERDGQ